MACPPRASLEAARDGAGIPGDKKPILYVRSAYRNDPEFQMSRLQRTGRLVDETRAVPPARRAGQRLGREDRAGPRGRVPPRVDGRRPLALDAQDRRAEDGRATPTTETRFRHLPNRRPTCARAACVRRRFPNRLRSGGERRRLAAAALGGGPPVAGEDAGGPRSGRGRLAGEPRAERGRGDRERGRWPARAPRREARRDRGRGLRRRAGGRPASQASSCRSAPA